MPGSRRSLRGPHAFSTLLGVVLALPAAGLALLGVWLLQQDRALASQRRAEIVQAAADRAVRAFEQELAAVSRRLAEPGWPPADAPADAVAIALTASGVRVVPGSAVAWFPDPQRLPDARRALFDELESAEYRAGDLPRALALARELAGQGGAADRAGALVRQARILKKLGRAADAAATYRQMAAITTAAIEGVPADLVSTQALCGMASAAGESGVAHAEAVELQSALDAGRWQLDRATYELVASRLDNWLGPDRRRNFEREAAAEAVAWLTGQRNQLPSAGSRAFGTGGASVVLVWSRTADGVAALAALPAFVDREWRPLAERAARPASVSLTTPRDPTRSRPSTATTTPDAVIRTADVTGLPLTITAALAAGSSVDPLEGRRRALLAGLAAVLLFVATGGYVVIRTRNRELELSRLQSDFVAAVSHEFRTPLTSLRQFNEMLEDDEQMPAQTRRSYHRAQSRATVRLHRLVESLLDFGRMEAGRRPYSFEALDAASLVHDLVEEFQAGLDGQGFEIRCHISDGDHTVEADAEAIGRAVWNLLDNAVKYSGDSRMVDVTVEGASQDVLDAAVTIAVRDGGIGIPRAEQGRIFGKFVRGRGATTAHIKGTGIGLAMAQHIVTAHRGRIGVESEPGQGSTFTIVLPRRC